MLQYIGARYVPIFYQNSLDPTSTEWENNVTYEPMTWVSLPNGHMYISKKEVPANIGSPALNGEYWLEAGQYNAYIQSLQDQIDAINNTTIPDINNSIDGVENQIDVINNTTIPGINNSINTINNTTIPAITNEMDSRITKTGEVRKAIIVGDSWTKGYTGSGVPEHSYTIQLENMNIFDSIYVSATLDAPGFIRNTTFAQQFATISALHDDITDVIITGGVNDSYVANIAAIKTAAISLFNTIKTTYPNARMYYFPNLNFPSTYVTSQLTELAAIEDLMRALDQLGVTCSLAPYLSIAFDFDFWINDNLHLNNLGYDTFGCNVGNICLGQKPVAYPMKNSGGGTIQFSATFTHHSVDVLYYVAVDNDGNVLIEISKTGGSNYGYQLSSTIARLFPRNVYMGNNSMRNSFCMANYSGFEPSNPQIIHAAMAKTSNLFFFVADGDCHHVLQFNLFDIYPEVNYFAYDNYNG